MLSHTSFRSFGNWPAQREARMLRRPLKVRLKKSFWMLALLLAFTISTFGQDLATKLLEAAKTRNTAEVKKLLAEGADANAKDKGGWTALIWAVYFSRTNTVRALLEKGADVNATREDGETALMNAGSDGDQDIVRTLLERGATVNARDSDGWTALFWAASSGRTDIVRTLLEKGADVDSVDSVGKTALMSAAIRGQTETVRTLIEKGADVNARSKDGHTVLMAAVDLGRIDTVRALLESGADLTARDRKGVTALQLAAKYKYSEIVALLRNPPQVSRKENPNNTATSTLAASSTVPKVSSAPQPPPPTSASEGSLVLARKLVDAAEAGDTSEVRSLLREGANTNARASDGQTALMGAAVRGHTDTVRVLLKAGADANAAGNTGRTALMEAALEGYKETILALLEKGANVNAKDNEGWTALFWATFSRRANAVRILLENGADVNAKNKYEDTALVRAAYGGDTDTLAVLLEKGADVNAQDDMGRTALIEAARQGHLDTVRALLGKGADANVPDRDGATALSAAEKHNYSVIVALLKNPPGSSLSTNAGNKVKSLSGESSVIVASSSADLTTETRELTDAQAQAFYRIGLNIRLVEDLWLHAGPMGARWANSIHDDLRKVDSPAELIQLAQQASIHLSSSTNDHDGNVALLIRNLRSHLDGFCEQHTEDKFFYAAGGFTYSLTLLGEDVEFSNNSDVNVEDGRRKTFPLASALAAQCSRTAACKARALPYFLAAAALLRGSQLIPADGSKLLEVSADIEQALRGDEH